MVKKREPNVVYLPVPEGLVSDLRHVMRLKQMRQSDVYRETGLSENKISRICLGKYRLLHPEDYKTLMAFIKKHQSSEELHEGKIEKKGNVDSSSILARMNELKEKLGTTWAVIAKELNVSESTVHRIRQGERRIQPFVLNRIKKSLEGFEESAQILKQETAHLPDPPPAKHSVIQSAVPTEFLQQELLKAYNQKIQFLEAQCGLVPSRGANQYLNGKRS